MSPSKYHLYKQQLLSPEIFQAELMASYVQGNFVERGDVVSPYMRAQVISVDTDGGKLENPAGEGSCRSRNPITKEYYDIPARVGPKNPARALRARIVSEHRDANTDDEDLRIFYPEGTASSGPDPIPLEFVYIWFEQNDKRHGIWHSKVAGPMGEKLNFADGSTPYEQNAGNQQEYRLASAHGDAPQPQINYAEQESVVGAKPDGSKLAGKEYS